ncbi:MAG: bifunctional oligoribonuclease/PAP phosphatase NrnA [Clostridiales bacterium]|nr:bifunctional oligoribonuclease/PAP phosphatase NrnA [Clostridiales bacterium]
MNEYLEFYKFIENQRSLLLTGHSNPDADCITSMLALDYAFSGQEKGWQLVLTDPVPDYLNFLPDWQRITTPDQLRMIPQDILLVDCAEESRTGEKWKQRFPHSRIHAIDHHLSHAFAGGLLLSRPEAAATAEVIFQMLDQAKRPWDKAAALLLYTGMVADTACFRYSNTKPDTLAAASKLLKTGFDPLPVIYNLFERQSIKNMHMLSVALGSVQLAGNGQIAWMVIDKASMEHYRANGLDCYNIVNYALNPDGVKLGLLFEEDSAKIKVSIRSRPGFAANELALIFNGGGHKQAAGCQLCCSLQESIELVLREARRMLEPRGL